MVDTFHFDSKVNSKSSQYLQRRKYFMLLPGCNLPWYEDLPTSQASSFSRDQLIGFYVSIV